MGASHWDECVDDRVVLKSVRRWCSQSLSWKEQSREIIGHPECTYWICFVDTFHQSFPSLPVPSHLRVLHSSLQSTCRLIRFTRSSDRGGLSAQWSCVWRVHLHDVVSRFAVRLLLFFSEECPYNNFHVFRSSSRNACSSLSSLFWWRLSRVMDSFFCASFLLDERWGLKNFWVVSFMQSIKSVQCTSGVGSSRNTSNFIFAFSKELSTACKISTRLSPFCKQSAIAYRSHLIRCRSVDVSPLWDCRMYLKTNRIGTWSRGSPTGMSCSLRPVCQSTGHSYKMWWIPTSPTQWSSVREVSFGEKYADSESGNIVVIEVLSVILSRFSISCPVTFCSSLWSSPSYGSSTCSSTLQCQIRVEIQSQNRCASLLYFCYLFRRNSIVRRIAFSFSRLRSSLSESGGGKILRSVQSKRPLRSLNRSCLLIRREKIIEHPVDEFVQDSFFPSEMERPVSSSQFFRVISSVVSSSQTCVRTECHVCPTFVGHVL